MGQAMYQGGEGAPPGADGAGGAGAGPARPTTSSTPSSPRTRKVAFAFPFFCSRAPQRSDDDARGAKC